MHDSIPAHIHRQRTNSQREAATDPDRSADKDPTLVPPAGVVDRHPAVRLVGLHLCGGLPHPSNRLLWTGAANGIRTRDPKNHNLVL